MKVVIVDYGIGNLGSIPNMLARLGVEAVITGDGNALQAADRIILPGVGAFGAGMASLLDRGLREPLEQRVLRDGVPTLGLCLGMQMMFDGSEEADIPGLGWFSGRVTRFRPDQMERPLPVPNMGWLEVSVIRPIRILHELGPEPRFYFAHSYHVQPSSPADVAAVATYGYDFAVCVERDNIAAAQFHPEKSHRFGLQLLRNFVAD